MKLTNKIIRLLAIVSLVTLSCFSYAQLKLRGHVGVAGKPAEGVNVLLTAESGNVLQATTDSLGSFAFFTLKKGNYTLSFSHLSYRSVWKQVAIHRDTIISVWLEKRTQLLKDVNVRAKTKLLERKIDRTIFNISGNKALTGADAIEAINLMPGVKVRNKAIQVAGKGLA